MGKGIKVFAITVMILGMIGCAAFAVINLFRYHFDKAFITYIDYYEEYGTNALVTKEMVERGYVAQAEFSAFIYYLCGFFASLLFGLLLYWFGCLFVKVENIERSLQKQATYPGQIKTNNEQWENSKEYYHS